MKRGDVIAAAATLLIAVSQLSAQAQGALIDYQRAARYAPWNFGKLVFEAAVTPHWMDDDRFWYRNELVDGSEFMLVDANSGSKAPAFDHQALAESLSRARPGLYTARTLPFTEFAFRDRAQRIEFSIENERWTCTLSPVACSRARQDQIDAPKGIESPDGRWVAFVRAHDVYVRPSDSSEEIRLTEDGTEYYDYASQPDSALSAVTDRFLSEPPSPLLIWSPDSKRVLTHKVDQRRVQETYLVQTPPADRGGRPILHRYRLPLAGDPELPLAELVVLDVEKSTRTSIRDEPLVVRVYSPLEQGQAWWSRDGSHVYYVHLDRDLKRARLMSADAVSGATRLLLEEHSQTYVEVGVSYYRPRVNARVLRDGRVIWYSERTDWAHLYLCTPNPAPACTALTSGEWAVRDLLNVDEDGGWVYFTAGGREPGRDPYLRHLYRVRLDGSGLELLTPENADHLVTFSPSGRYFVDTSSRVDTVPVSYLRRADGYQALELERADVTRLTATGWRSPEPFTVKGADGSTDLYGVLYRPSNFDPARKYPIIEGLYPGPQSIRSAKWFSPSTFNHDPALAELGFIVVTMDGRGTPFRSKSFRDRSYGNLAIAGSLDDHIAGLKQLAVRYPYMDLERVGVFGGSGGGFAAVRAMLAYPDFYEVAVASSGNHDQRSYVAGWGEQYLGLPGWDLYAQQSSAALAGQLRGKLLLVHGLLDDNVHPAMTLQLADALIAANKDFDLLVVPNANHGLRDITDRKRREVPTRYVTRRRWDYFVRHLLGVEPPKDFELRESAHVTTGEILR